MLAEIIGAIFLIAGGLLCFAAGLGIVRLPDVFLRMHAATKAGTLGLGFIVVATCITEPSVDVIVKAALVAIFMFATAPIGSHLIGRAAFRNGTPFADETYVDANCKPFEQPIAERYDGTGS